jgi:hypothetical protein
MEKEMIYERALDRCLSFKDKEQLTVNYAKELSVMGGGA